MKSVDRVGRDVANKRMPSPNGSSIIMLIDTKSELLRALTKKTCIIMNTASLESGQTLRFFVSD